MMMNKEQKSNRSELNDEAMNQVHGGRIPWQRIAYDEDEDCEVYFEPCCQAESR